MPNLPILKTECDVNYSTPAGSTLKLNINCANSDTDGWPWKYFWTKTIGSGNVTPQLQNGTDTSPYFVIEGASGSGQVVLRGIFAYIATDPITAEINCSAEMTVTQSSQPANTANYELIARLYEPDGSLVSTFFDVNEKTESATVTLPATVCPKVLWVGSLVQPAGPLPYPACQASISVTVT